MTEAAASSTEGTLLGSQPADGGQPAADAQAAPPQGQPAASGQPAEQGGEQSGQQPAAEAAALDLAKIALPDGRKLDEALLSEFRPLAEKYKVGQEQAQELVAFFDKAQQQAHQQSLQAFEQMKADWLSQVRSDPEIGGTKLLETTAYAAKAVRLAGGEALQKVLNETGMGNHPAFVKAFAALGRLISSDTTGSAATGDPGAAPKDIADRLYGAG